MTQNSLTANTCREIDAEPSPCEHLGDLTDLEVAGYFWRKIMTIIKNGMAKKYSLVGRTLKIFCLRSEPHVLTS